MNISKERMHELEKKEKKLLALEVGGVDNWEFYSESMKEYHNDIEYEEKLNDLLEEIEVAILEGVYEPSEKGAGYCSQPESRDNAFEILKLGFQELSKIKGCLK